MVSRDECWSEKGGQKQTFPGRRYNGSSALTALTPAALGRAVQSACAPAYFPSHVGKGKVAISR
jgi:hypothetical protein